MLRAWSLFGDVTDEKNALLGNLYWATSMARPKRSGRDCPYETAAQALKCLGGRWKILILKRLLDHGPVGFNDMRRALPGVSAKMLAQQLRELEADGVIVRRELVSTPPKTVTYEASALGEEAGPLIEALSTWGRGWIASRPNVATEEM